MGQAHGDHCYTPQNHDDRNENTGAKALEQDVGQGFEEGIRDEEDGEAGIVLAAGNMEALLEAIKPGIAYIGTIEEGNEVEEAEPGDKAEVELS